MPAQAIQLIGLRRARCGRSAHHNTC